MQRNKKRFVFLLFILLAAASFWAVRYVVRSPRQIKDIPNTEIDSSNKENPFILNNYPLSTVPLYEINKLESMKYFVNDERNQLVNYYNVVFKTNVSKEQLLSYYQSLMTAQDSDESTEDRVVGMIDVFNVAASMYEDSTVYLEVYLPQEKLVKTNPYYTDYPQDLVMIQNSWLLKESSYGKLNQRGGEIEYAEYFNIPDEQDESGKDDPWDYYYQMYKKMYADRTNMVATDEQKMLQWESSNYTVTLTFSSSHQRVYLVIRTAMDQAK